MFPKFLRDHEWKPGPSLLNKKDRTHSFWKIDHEIGGLTFYMARCSCGWASAKWMQKDPSETRNHFNNHVESVSLKRFAKGVGKARRTNRLNQRFID